MKSIPSMEDRVIRIIIDFLGNVGDKEPFEAELTKFRLLLRAKLLEIVTSFPTEPDMANRSLNYTLEGIERVVKDSMRRINLESEEILYRTIQGLKVINRVLKEFMREDRVNDKRKLSSLTGYIGNAVEKLECEHRRRFGGFLRSIKRLLGRRI